MKKIKGHLRCTTVKEVIDRVNDEAILKLFAIVEQEVKEQKSGYVNKIPYCNWVDKYFVNVYRLETHTVSFLIEGKELIFILDKSRKIKDYRF